VRELYPDKSQRDALKIRSDSSETAGLLAQPQHARQQCSENVVDVIKADTHPYSGRAAQACNDRTRKWMEINLGRAKGAVGSTIHVDLLNAGA